VRKVTWSWLRIKHMRFKPEYDLAILDIDPAIDPAVADKLDLKDSKPLALDFESQRRAIGSPVTWLTTAAQGDLTLTPRLFTGNIIANYIADETYSYQSNGNAHKQVIVGAKMLEIDKLFLPGSSGSPILNSETNQVIGFVHGYRAFALGSNIETTEDVEIGLDAELIKEKLKYRPPLVTSVSLGIDLRTAQPFFAEEGYVSK
jgi:Trypsin-like peptidase domain